MHKTKQLVYRAYLVGFLISASLLTPSLPFLGFIITPFLFHFIIHTTLKTNVSVILLYSTLELLLSMGSPVIFLTSLIEQIVLVLFTIFINIIKKRIRRLTFILYCYYVVHSHLIFLLFLGIFFYITNESITILLNNQRLIVLPLILIAYNILLLLMTYSLNRTVQSIFKYFNPIKKTVGFPTVN